MRRGCAVAALCLANSAALSTQAADPSALDAIYEALHGPPETVDPELMLASPGRFVGRAVRTSGRLVRNQTAGQGFGLSAGRNRAVLRLEPRVAAMVAARTTSLTGREVEVIGFFHREFHEPEASAYALRAWSVEATDSRSELRSTGSLDAPLITLEELVYAAGRLDGKLIRVRGAHRGANAHRDLPEATRQGAGDWVLKEGYFAVWVTAGEARVPRPGSMGSASMDTDTPAEVLGVPTTSNGLVRIAAREVSIPFEPAPGVVRRASVAGDAGWAAVPPRVSFTWPVSGHALHHHGQVIIQFSKHMDPSRFEANVSVRYEREGTPAGVPEVSRTYNDRYRALVLTPRPPPGPRTDVVVDLLPALIDIDGRALEARDAPERGGHEASISPAVERLRFRSHE